jgi:hypothetical protein
MGTFYMKFRKMERHGSQIIFLLQIARTRVMGAASPL